MSTANVTGTRPKVLVVEDERGIREVLARALYRQGFELVVAESGSEAVSLKDEEIRSLDLVISDLVMPGTNGADVAAVLRERAPGLNVLFISGTSAHPALERVLARGETFIQKPFSLAELRDAVSRTIAREGSGAPAAVTRRASSASPRPA